MSDTRRVSISLPPALVDDLDYISQRLGISRSAFLAQMLSSADLPAIRTLLSHIPAQPSDGDVRRFRGDSKAYVAQQMEKLASMQGGLFDEPAK